MSAGSGRIGLGNLVRNGEDSLRSRLASIWLKRGLLWLLAAIVTGGAVWLVMPPSEGNVAQTGPVKMALATIDPASPTTASDTSATQAAGLDGLKISSQTWRRGGLGSKALVTFTLRNDNDYAVRDVEIVCAFARRDGSHLTDRSRVLADIVGMKSRKTFARVPVGFVNVNADQAKCSLVTARRV
ncbi:hypothetical protein ACFQZO_24335 [Bradyrhizobium sp. GCM10027634]|uniref:hypothetical protein n=1 Tax=unclassified Bradyrhizobium TaxID=2631580 RepID=UPI00188D28DB|nr:MULTISPECIES: hypothetical protein [unclassified Bradyrhizobium]MDN5003971.1 hypothetical protein [Bradyrhizobium sp. WYCCWR 12677]QOZ44897.1 hypothetical protein XH89_16495 [Bradyrhizobium sp. CCBAU 53340]